MQARHSKSVHPTKKTPSGFSIGLKVLTGMAVAVLLIVMLFMAKIIAFQRSFKEEETLPTTVASGEGSKETEQAETSLNKCPDGLMNGIDDGKSHELIVVCIGDSITFGNGSHNTHRKRERRGNGEGSFPSELQELFVSANENWNQFRHIRVFNFGVSGSTVSSSKANKRSYRHMPEYHLAKSLIQEATALNGEGSLTNIISHFSGDLEGFQPQRRSSYSSNDDAAPQQGTRTVLLVLKLGTNDSKDKAWLSRNYFVNEYVSLVNGLLPVVLRNSTSNVGSGRALQVFLTFLTPIPVFPRPSSATWRKPPIGGLHGLRVATEIREGVLATAQQVGKLLPRLVSYFDLQTQFWPLLEEAPQYPSLVVQARLLHSEAEYLTFTRKHLSVERTRSLIHDGVHPAQRGHREMARLVFEFVRCFRN